MNLLANGGFERADSAAKPAEWTANGLTDAAERRSGARSLSLCDGASAFQDIWWPTPGAKYTCAIWLKTEDVRPSAARGYAYLAVYQFDLAGALVAFRDFAQLTGTNDWKRFTYTFEAARNAARLSVRVGLFQAQGKAWVDDAVLVEGHAAPEFAAVAEPAAFAPTDGKGRIAILKDDLPVEGVASSPDHLGQALRAAGFDVRFLSADALADPQQFNRRKFELVVLPYGASFPLDAHRSFLRFLQQGGHFISLGGYALDNLLVKTASGWKRYDWRPEARCGPELLPDSGFEDGKLTGWQKRHADLCRVDDSVAHSGKHSGVVSVPPQGTPPQAEWFCSVPLKQGVEYRFSAWIRTQGVKPTTEPGYAYVAAYQYGPDPPEGQPAKLIAHRDVLHVVGDSDWQRCEHTFKPEAGAVRVELKGGLWRAAGQAWFDDFSLREMEPEIRLNTRRGEPDDSLRVSPHQIGVFDPSYRLKRVAYASAGPGQAIFPDGIRLDGPLEGFAASGVLGYDNARWTSLVTAHDRYGRLRGSVGALMRHYHGRFRKSVWAFFGATNRDLFPPGDARMSAAFARLAEAMLRGTFLHNLSTNWATYDPGEEAQIFVHVSNFGWQPRELTVRFNLLPRAIELPPQTLKVPPGETATATVSFRVPANDSKFYRVLASLHLGAEVIDQLESGFVVRDERAIQSGPKLRFVNNYLECDGRARVLLGTDTYGSMFSSAQQSPLTWQRDVQKCQDFGVSVFENLQVNPTTFTKPYEADEKFLRQVDGLVQLCQAHRLVYLPCLLCGYNTVASDEDLAKQAAYPEAFARRYAKVPGIAYYVNGDLSFRWIDSPDIKRLWNEFLRQRYGTDERLREAWRLNPPEAKLGDLPVSEPRPKGWADIRTCDFHEFKIRLVERWIDAQHRACRRGDPEHPTTVEYYQLPHGGIDMRRSMAGLDLGNIGYFGHRGKDIADFPRILKFNDLRVVGKGVSVGEFGVKTHPAWSPEEGYTQKTYHTMRTEAEQLDLFLAIPHYTLGLGGAKMHNWCWLDADEWVFPWGLCYPCDNVEKDALCIYRNVGLLFRLFEPVYVPPRVYLLMPDTHRLGQSAPAVQSAVLKAIDTLLDLHVDFAPIGEADLDRLPKEARAIMYPIPFCLSDATYELLKRFVTNGGALYISGDFSFDPLRQRTRTARLRDLAGVEFLAENYAGIASDASHERPASAVGEWKTLPGYSGRPCMRLKLASAAPVMVCGDGPVAVVNRVTKGKVFFTADAPELWQPDDSDALRALYKAFLAWTGVGREAASPDDPAIHAFRLSTKDGGAVRVFFNTDREKTKIVAFPTRSGVVELLLGPMRPGLALETADGKLAAVEATAAVKLNGQVLVGGDAHFALCAFDAAQDQKPDFSKKSGFSRSVDDAERFLLLPFSPGSLALRLPGLAPNAKAQVGDVRQGRWRAYETMALDYKDGAHNLKLDEARAASMVVIGPETALAAMGQQVAAMLTQP